MKESERLCPHCGVSMEEFPVKAEPNAIPKIAAQPLNDVKAGVLLTRLECPSASTLKVGIPRARERGRTLRVIALVKPNANLCKVHFPDEPTRPKRLLASRLRDEKLQIQGIFNLSGTGEGRVNEQVFGQHSQVIEVPANSD